MKIILIENPKANPEFSLTSHLEVRGKSRAICLTTSSSGRIFAKVIPINISYIIYDSKAKQ